MGTIKHTLSAINAMRYVCARWISETGEYRVCPRFDHLSGSKRNERREACAYYTDDAADAFDTAAHFNSRLEADINAYD